MMEWPPRSVIGFVALIGSIFGAVALTAVVVFGLYLIVYGAWTVASEAVRAAGLVNVLLIVSVGLVVVMVGLGWAINRRQIKGGFGGANGPTFEMSGGEEVERAVDAVADAAVDKAAEVKGA